MLESTFEVIIKTLQIHKPAWATKWRAVYEVLSGQPEERGPRMPRKALEDELVKQNHWSQNKAISAVKEALQYGFIKPQKVLLPPDREEEKRKWDDMHERGSFSGKLYRPEFETDYVVLWDWMAEPPADCVPQEELGHIPDSLERYRRHVRF